MPLTSPPGTRWCWGAGAQGLSLPQRGLVQDDSCPVSCPPVGQPCGPGSPMPDSHLWNEQPSQGAGALLLPLDPAPPFLVHFFNQHSEELSTGLYRF